MLFTLKQKQIILFRDILYGHSIWTIEAYSEYNLRNNFSVIQSGRMRGDGM